MRGKYEDLSGRRFGRLFVLERAGRSRHGVLRYRCHCDCGSETLSLANSLRTGRAQSCGCLNRERVRRACSKAPGESAFNNTLYKYRQQAKDRGLVFDISRSEFHALVASLCTYCGAPPQNVMKAAGGDILYNGIDRVDNDVGYVSGNVVPCCKICNIAKGRMSVEEFYRWVSKVHDRRNDV